MASDWHQTDHLTDGQTDLLNNFQPAKPMIYIPKWLLQVKKNSVSKWQSYEPIFCGLQHVLSVDRQETQTEFSRICATFSRSSIDSHELRKESIFFPLIPEHFKIMFPCSVSIKICLFIANIKPLEPQETKLSLNGFGLRSSVLVSYEMQQLVGWNDCLFNRQCLYCWAWFWQNIGLMK